MTTKSTKSTKRPKIRMATRRTPFATIEEAVDAIRAGQMVIVVDDEDRENEGDLTIAAEKITPEVINFMATHGRGLICMPMTAERLDELELPLMVNQNTTPFKTAFCVSIEAKHSVSTGISASDRAATVLAAIDAKTKPSDLARPGHMFPLRARTGGVMVRAGQTEAAVDLARIAGLYPDRPKALVPVAGRPFIDRQLAWLVAHGLVDVVLCAGHGAHALAAHVGDGTAFGVRLRIVVERGDAQARAALFACCLRALSPSDGRRAEASAPMLRARAQTARPEYATAPRFPYDVASCSERSYGLEVAYD